MHSFHLGLAIAAADSSPVGGIVGALWIRNPQASAGRQSCAGGALVGRQLGDGRGRATGSVARLSRRARPRRRASPR